MYNEEYTHWLSEYIERLENDGLVNGLFRECYLLKKDTDSRFFVDLIDTFCKDACKVVKKMGQILNRRRLDFDNLNECCIKLKGSAASIGACSISGACSNLHLAIENKSKEGCLQVLNNIKNEFKRLRYRLNAVLRVSRSSAS